MGLAFNPFTGNFDFTGASAGATGWTGPVATESALPVVGNSDGDAKVTKDTDYIWVWNAASSRWINSGVKSASVGSSPNSSGYSLSTTNVSTNRTELQLVLQPADGSNPGLITSGTQSIGGVKTFNARINADGGIDSSGATLNIGATTASTITIGRSGTTINMVGSTTYEQVTNLQVADKLITINKGGGATTGSGSGFEVEENNVITGYVKTSTDRNSWQLLAPNTAGVVTVTPGSSGFTIDQGSHNPVTIGTANGLSLSTQQISLALSSTSTTGALSSTDWNTFNNKQDAGNYITALTGDATASGPGSAALTFATVNSDVGSFGGASSVPNFTVNAKGLITAAGSTTVVAPAGTLTGTTLASNVVTSSLTSVGTIGTGTWQGTAVAPTYGGTGQDSHLSTGIAQVSSGTWSFSTALASGTTATTQSANDNSTKVATTAYIDGSYSPKSSGDIAETSFTASNNQSSAANVTGLAFANATVRSFHALISIVRGSTYQQSLIVGVQKGSDWVMSETAIGDDCGISFTITTAGQIQYTSTNTGSSATVKFRAFTTTV